MPERIPALHPLLALARIRLRVLGQRERLCEDAEIIDFSARILTRAGWRISHCGVIDDVDACLAWHPSNQNQVSVQPSKALRSFEVIFHGRSAHAELNQAGQRPK